MHKPEPLRPANLTHMVKRLSLLANPESLDFAELGALARSPLWQGRLLLARLKDPMPF